MKNYRYLADLITNRKTKKKYKLPSEAQERDVFLGIDKNFEFLKTILGDAIGLVGNKYSVLEDKVHIGVMYIGGMIDTKRISGQVIEPLVNARIEFTADTDIITALQTKLIYTKQVKKSNQMKQVVDGLLTGSAVIFVEGTNQTLIIDSRKLEYRSVEKPDNEITLFAAMDSFNEDIETNSSLLIRRLPTPDLQFKSFTVGTLYQTEVKLLWIEGIANEKFIEEATRRIKQIDIDAVESIGALSELIRDDPLAVFPTHRQTQRPDVAAKMLTEGRFAILCSNSPFALVAPISFWDNFKTMDDYSETPIVATFLRNVRAISFVLAILISPLYLSLVAYNHTILPPTLSMNIATGREGVPFPSVIELLIMTFSIDIIRESSLRAAGSVGFFIGVLSAVVIGQATVEAGYVSASVIIVVAITAISTFAISTTSLVYPARLTNYFLILLASLFGIFGLINGIIIVLWRLVSLKSFGVPYLYPVVPFELEGMKDTFIRAPIKMLRKRLRIIAPFNRIRMDKKGE